MNGNGYDNGAQQQQYLEQQQQYPNQFQQYQQQQFNQFHGNNEFNQQQQFTQEQQQYPNYAQFHNNPATTTSATDFGSFSQNFQGYESSQVIVFDQKNPVSAVRKLHFGQFKKVFLV